MLRLRPAHFANLGADPLKGQAASLHLRELSCIAVAFLWAIGFLGVRPTAFAQEAPLSPAEQVPIPSKDVAADADHSPHLLIEEFTAHTLAKHEFKLGTEVEWGVTPQVMLGTDLVSNLLGAPTVQGKFLLVDRGEHKIALGVRAAYLSKKTLLWGSVNEHFKELDARIIRPSVSWSHVLSPRLSLHTFWGKGIGTVHAELSEKGRRKLWETKHPGDNYDDYKRETDAGGTEEKTTPPTTGDTTNSKQNQEKAQSQKSSLTQQSIQVQSITGLAQDRFQLTGEFNRKSGNKVLVTTRIEQTIIEDLKSNFIRLTVAHQWVWTNFQMRLGIGVQYFVMTGNDLDGEKIDEAGTQPASDIAFYWRF